MLLDMLNSIELDPESEDASLANHRLDHNVTTHVLTQLLRYHQSKTHSLLVEVSWILEFAKHLKQILLVFFLHANAGIPNADFQVLTTKVRVIKQADWVIASRINFAAAWILDKWTHEVLIVICLLNNLRLDSNSS